MTQHEGTTAKGSRAEALVVGLAFCLLGLGAAAMGMRGWLPQPMVSHHGAGVDRMLVYLLAATGALLVVGHLVLAYGIWRFSGRSKVAWRLKSARVERRWSVVLGVVMTLVAEGGVLVIGLPVWAEYFGSKPPAEAVPVEITGEQFAWNVRYPGPDGEFGRAVPELVEAGTNPLGLDPEDPAAADDIVRTNRVVLPVDRPARVRLRSKDVIHSFFLPHLRVKQDAVPGLTIEIWFTPTEEGSYEIACTELCGLGHYRMQGTLQVVSAEAFANWLAEQGRS